TRVTSRSCHACRNPNRACDGRAREAIGRDTIARLRDRADGPPTSPSAGERPPIQGHALAVAACERIEQTLFELRAPTGYERRHRRAGATEATMVAGGDGAGEKASSESRHMRDVAFHRAGVQG